MTANSHQPSASFVSAHTKKTEIQLPCRNTRVGDQPAPQTVLGYLHGKNNRRIFLPCKLGASGTLGERETELTMKKRARIQESRSTSFRVIGIRARPGPRRGSTLLHHFDVF